MEPVAQRLEPLSWLLGLRRPGGQRRRGPLYVMNSDVQAQLSPLGPLREARPDLVVDRSAFQ